MLSKPLEGSNRGSSGALTPVEDGFNEEVIVAYSEGALILEKHGCLNPCFRITMFGRRLFAKTSVCLARDVIVKYQACNVKGFFEPAL